MNNRTISTNEKLVLYGLVRYPLMNVRELSEKIDLKISTITAIKKRLCSRGFFTTVRVPNPATIGYELMTISFAEINPVDPGSVNDGVKKMAGDLKGVSYLLTTPGHVMALGINLNYTEATRNVEGFKSELKSMSTRSEQGTKHVFFPLATSQLNNYFDYSHILNQTYPDLGNMMGESDRPQETRPGSIDQLSPIEKKVLKGLVDFPDLPDSRIAEKIKTTRQVIAKLRKRFESEDVIRTLNVLNLDRLGFEILSMDHLILDPAASEGVRNKAVSKYLDTVPHIFTISNDMEMVSLNAYRRFSDYQSTLFKIKGDRSINSVLSEDIRSNLLSMDTLDCPINHSYEETISSVIGSVN